MTKGNGNGDGGGNAEANAYLAAIVESSDDAIISKNLDGVVTSWNSAAERIFGYTASEAVGKPLADLIIPSDRTQEEGRILADIRQGKKLDRFQTVRISKDGRPVEVSITVSPIHSSEGVVVGASKVARDIGVLRAAEEAGAYLAAIVTSSDDAIISKNTDGIITSWNTAAERMYGYSAQEAIGQSIYLIIPEGREHEEVEITARLHHGEKIDHFETMRRVKGGGFLNVSVTISPIFDSQGRIIGASKVARDISERKRHEEEINSQRQWFEVTLESIGDAVIATDENLKLKYLNSVAGKLTGWSLGEVIGKPVDEVLNIINEDMRLPTVNPLHEVIKSGEARSMDGPTLLVARDGTEYSIEDAAAPIRLPDGRLIGAVLVFRDIGDKRGLEKELKGKAQILAEKDRRKDEFLAILAHELRNPLAPISNAIHIARKKEVRAETKEQALDMASQQVAHMVRLLDDLLDISRITHGKISLNLERIDLCGAIRHAIDTASPLINAHNHALGVSLPSYPVWVNGDATRLAQLFGNLLNNAAKYTLDGGMISLGMEEKGGAALVRIRDNGIGIAPDQLPHIFDMFKQVDSSMERTYGGLGIGLTLVRSIAELHGGSVEAHSEGEGGGTEFTVSLPIIMEASKSVGGCREIKDVPSVSYRILVVDDNEASAKTLGWMMEAMGHEVELACSAISALDAVWRFRPQVVLLDIGMPVMNGYDLCREMRLITGMEKAVFIAQTGWGQDRHLRRSKEAGFDLHLIKPVSFEDLQAHLNRIKPGQ